MRADVHSRVSVCQFSTYRWSFHEDVVRYSSHGFDSIGVWRRKIEDYGTAAAIDLLFETKMSVSSVHWAGGFTGDGRTFADSIEDAIEAIQLASQLGAGCLILHPGSRNGHTTSHASRLFKSALSHLVPIAADYGVKLAFEPMVNKQASCWTFMKHVNDTLEMLAMFPAAHLGWIFDTYHCGFDADLFDQLDDFVDRLELVQLADRNLLIENTHRSRQGNDAYRLPLGEGQVPIEAWLSKLQGLGYSGGFEVEVHGSSVNGMDYTELLNITADYLENQKVSAMLNVRKSNQSSHHGLSRKQLNQKQVD